MKTQTFEDWLSLPHVVLYAWLVLHNLIARRSRGGRGEASDNPGLHVNLVIRENSLSSIEKTFLFKIFSSDNNNNIVFYVEFSKWLPIKADCSHFPHCFFLIQQRKPGLVSTFQSSSINVNCSWFLLHPNLILPSECFNKKENYYFSAICKSSVLTHKTSNVSQMFFNNPPSKIVHFVLFEFLKPVLCFKMK